jgi:hypothetical protein
LLAALALWCLTGHATLRWQNSVDLQTMVDAVDVGLELDHVTTKAFLNLAHP